MMRNLKALGLCFAAVLVLSAVAANASANVKHHFTAESEPTHITGDDDGGEHILRMAALEIKCETTELSGTQNKKTAEELTLTPKFEGCKIGATKITIHNEGCSYVFHSETTPNPANTTPGESASTDWECNHTGRITVTAPGCDIEFSDTHPGVEGTVNQGLHGVKYNNVNTSGKTEITIQEHSFGLRFRTLDTIAGACALVGHKQGTYSDGTFVGNMTLKGYSDAAHTQQAGLSLTENAT